MQPRLKRARVIKADTAAEANEVHRAAIITVMNGKKWVHARLFRGQVKQTLGEKWSNNRFNAVKAKMMEDDELELMEMKYKLKSTKATAVSVSVTTRSNNEKLGLTIKKKSCEKYTYIQVNSIDPGSLFGGTALRSGMFLYSINGVKCKSYEHGRSLLKDTEGSMHIMAGYARPVLKEDMA